MSIIHVRPFLRKRWIHDWATLVVLAVLIGSAANAANTPSSATPKALAVSDNSSKAQIQTQIPGRPPTRLTARGVVFDDQNKDGKRQPEEPGVAGVAVSDGEQIVETNPQGQWSLDISGNAILFLTKPSGYSLPIDQDNLPRFYYIHRPEGSVVNKGIKPTGPLPDSIDFPLIKTVEPDDFRVLVLSDPQSGTYQEIGYLRDDVFTELVGVEAAFGVVLGDLAGDGFDNGESYIRNVARIGIPLYNILGNHDENYDSPDDENSHETFSNRFGPAYHSWDYGKVHFMALDTIIWKGAGKGGGNYEGGIAPRMLSWAKKDLARTPKDRLIVLMMHIPFYESEEHIKDVEEFFGLFVDRPRILALAGHTHTVEHYIFDEKNGWKGSGRFHEMVCTTGCGSWWSGPMDLRGIPAADCRDGAPNGYTFLDFKGNDYTSTLKGANLDRKDQMRIYIPGTYEYETAPTPKLLVNVFDGWSKSTVEYNLDNGPWKAMNWKSQLDPLMRAYYSGPMAKAKSWVHPIPSTHIWEADFPAGLPGANPHVITVRVKDIYGREIKQSRIFYYRGE